MTWTPSHSHVHSIHASQDMWVTTRPHLLALWGTLLAHICVGDGGVYVSMCTHAAHSLQLAGANTGDEASQEAKCHPSAQRCGSLRTVPHTVKLGAGADSSQYPMGMLLCPAWAKAVMPQGDFWQHQTILSAFLSSHLYKFS